MDKENTNFSIIELATLNLQMNEIRKLEHKQALQSYVKKTGAIITLLIAGLIIATDLQPGKKIEVNLDDQNLKIIERQFPHLNGFLNTTTDNPAVIYHEKAGKIIKEVTYPDLDNELQVFFFNEKIAGTNEPFSPGLRHNRPAEIPAAIYYESLLQLTVDFDGEKIGKMELSYFNPAILSENFGNPSARTKFVEKNPERIIDEFMDNYTNY